MRRGWWLAGLLLVLSACTQWELPPVTERFMVVGASDWLEQARQVQEMPPTVQPGELHLREQAHEAEATTLNSLRLALLLGLGAETVRDGTRALALLERLDPTTLSAPEMALVGVLRQLLSERQQALVLLRAERKTVTQQEARIQELESQLEAVTSIEQSIRQRKKPLQGVEP